MPAIITTKFRFHNAEQFKESFSESAATNYYLYIGRPSAFATGTTGGTDAAPPTPVDARKTEAFQWDDMMAAKKIDATGVTHAVPRRDLDISGSTIYDMYRPDYSASKTATRLTSGRSKPSLNKFIPTNASKAPILNSLRMCTLSRVLISECKYLTRIFIVAI